jgi:hypothetical protein
MDFFYPKFENVTHQVLKNSPNTSAYPNTQNDINFFEIALPENIKVVAIRENVGFGCNWTLVKIIDKQYIQNANLYGKQLYIPKANLDNIGTKQTYEPICSELNNIDINAVEIDPNLKEILIPYVDKRNGFLSVRIQIDQERIIDNILFEKTLRDVFYEGINILLASRGLKSDNKTIEDLSNKFYTFGFVNKDFDQTINRRCEQLTFTISLPLNFFNVVPAETRQEIQQASQFLRFNSENFLTKINVLLELFSSKAGEIVRLTYPDKVIENFIIDFELLFIKKFAVAAHDLFTSAGYPIRTSNFTDFEIGFDNDLNIVSIKVSNNEKSEFLSAGFIKQAKLLSSFNSKRVFNYLFNLNSMNIDINNLDIYDFILKYVRYPNARLADATIIINNEKLSNEKLKTFSAIFKKEKEGCITTSDIAGIINSTDDIATDTLKATDIVLADPLFHLYVDTLEEPESKTITDQFNDDFEFIKISTPELAEYSEQQRYVVQSHAEDTQINIAEKKVTEDAKALEEAQTVDVNDQLRQGNNAAFARLKQKYAFSPQTFFYIAERINFNKFLFQHVFCYLKNLDPNSPEAKLITSTTPDLIIRYFYYLYKNKNLKGKELLKLAAEGFPLDFELFCSDNSALVYFIKGLLLFVNGIKSFNIPLFVTQLVNFEKNNKIKQPYKAYREALILGVERIATDILFKLIGEILKYSCEDDNLFNDSSDDFRDPFNTHIPISGFGNRKTNNDQNIIKRNRTNVLDDVYPKDLQLEYGFDSEFQIDLLDRLMTDIRCILSPLEAVNLLQGAPTPLVITLITNLIKNKYSTPPDDLSFLLADKDKMKLFFKKLGLTVDQEFLTELIPVIVNGTSASDLCDPQQLEARVSLIENKVPKNLGILEDQLRRRATSARTVFDRIKNGQIEVPYNPFCPDQFGEGVAEANNAIFEQYYAHVRNLFESPMNLFNSEARKLPDLFADNEFFYRKNSSGVFDIVDYTIFNTTLATNFKVKENTNSDKVFTFRPSLPTAEQLSDLFVPERRIETLSVGCDDVNKSISTDLFEFMNAEDSGLFTEIIFVDRNFEDTAEGSLKINKKIFMTITVDIDAEPLGWGTNTDQIEFKLYYNDIGTNKLKLLANIKWEGEIGLLGELDSSDNYDTSEDFAEDFIDSLTNTSWALLEIPSAIIGAGAVAAASIVFFGGAVISPVLLATLAAGTASLASILNFEWIEEINEFYKTNGIANDVAQLKANQSGKGFFRLNPITQKIIAYVFNTKFKPIIEQINKYEQFVNLNGSLYNSGLFNIKRDVLLNEGKIINTINITTGKNSNGEQVLIEEPYAIFEQKINKNYSEKYLDTTRIIGELGYKLLEKYFKPYTLIYDFNYSKLNEGTNAYETLTDIDFEDENFKETYFSNQNYKIQFKNETTAAKINYSKFALLDFPKDARYYACNITPHYFNIDRFLANAIDNSKTDVCEGFAPILDNIIKEIAINLLFRTYVTDYLTKAIPFLVALPRQKLENAHNNSTYVQILRNIMFKDMQTFGGFDKQNSVYISNKYFYKAVDEVYDSYKTKRKLINSFDTDGNSVNYFIRKEIRHFIKYAISKGMFKAGTISESSYRNIGRTPSAAAQQSDRDKFITEQERTTIGSTFSYEYSLSGYLEPIKNSDIYLSDEQFVQENSILNVAFDNYMDSMLSFFIMASIVDIKKQSAFSATKQALFNILFSTLPAESEEDTNLLNQFSAPRQEDVIKFLTDLGTSNNPALMIKLKPQYSKYLVYFLEQLIYETRRILLTIADTNDKNIFLTRRINNAISVAQSLMWSLTPQEERDKLIANSTNAAQKVFWARLDSGKSIIPDLLVSLQVMLKGIPITEIGAKYLAFDTLSEAIWIARAISGVRTSVGIDAEQDPCAIVENIPEIVSTRFECTVENKKDLIKEVDSFEEP